MKKIAIITPVPDMVQSIIEQSMLRKGAEKKLVEYHIVNLREFGEGNYRQIDDTPYGGGSGMVLLGKPLIEAIHHSMEWIGDQNIRIVFPSPQGQKWDHQTAMKFNAYEHFIFICGHYKGIDQRVIDQYVTDEFSIGDYVVTSGEIPAMIMIDSMVRLIPGVLNTLESAETDSFYTELLDSPYYTKPREMDGKQVPEVLIHGHHKEIENWRQSQKEKMTREKRPDLWQTYVKKNAMSE